MVFRCLVVAWIGAVDVDVHQHARHRLQDDDPLQLDDGREPLLDGLDPVLHVQDRHGLSMQQVETALNRESGLLGVSGVSADMRDVLAAARGGNEQAQLALDIYAHRVRQVIGGFAVTMGGIDALVFTAGVGEHAVEVRASICVGLECLGLELDAQANAERRPDADIATLDSHGRILVIATREDVTMLREVLRVLGNDSSASQQQNRQGASE